jgi:putative CocE/NonD family hydrolase
LALAVQGASGAGAPKVSRPGVYTGYSAQLYSDVSIHSQYIVMRDGIRLAATIYRPAIDGKADTSPWPVIWEGTTSRGRRNPDGSISYDAMRKTATIPGGLSAMTDLVKYGYVVVQIERRGQGASMGAMRGYHGWTESLDAYDITEWLAQQPWSNGRIGVYGCSNTGEAALHAATAMPPHLQAIFAGCFAWNKFDGFYRGGILANWGTGPQFAPMSAGMASIPVDEDKEEALLKQAIQEHQKQTNLLGLWESMPFRDSWSPQVESRFWIVGSVSTYQTQIERTSVGIYMTGGFKDDFRREQIIAYSNLHNPSKLLIGPWLHCQNEGFDLVTERLRFFDYWLKDIKNGIMNEPPIYYYTAGAPQGQEWRSATQWPLPNEQPTPYYLQAGKRLGMEKPVGASSKDTFQVNYNVEKEAHPGAFLFQPPGPQDEKGITYTTPALTREMELTGHPIVHLWVSSTANDGHFFAYLEDIDPSGKATVVTDGRLRASLRALGTAPYKLLGLPYHRGFAEDAEPLRPGQPEELVFDMLPLSRIFPAGDRIRITITGADPREKDRPESTPSPVVSIYRDRTHQSYIVLPLIPGN